MTGDPLTWQQWWDNVAMSGVVGGVFGGLIGGLATAVAVALTLRHERRLQQEAELRGAASQLRTRANRCSSAHMTSISADGVELRLSAVRDLTDGIWAVTAAGHGRSPELVRDMLFAMDQIGRPDLFAVGPAQDEWMRIICRDVQVRTQAWLQLPSAYRRMASAASDPKWQQFDPRLLEPSGPSDSGGPATPDPDPPRTAPDKPRPKRDGGLK